jgi:hypothetical protein
MSLTSPTGTRPLATAAAAPPSLLSQVGMAGTAAVITVSFIHPIDVVKVRSQRQAKIQIRQMCIFDGFSLLRRTTPRPGYQPMHCIRI